MTIVNRRNAILGWSVWQLAKRAAGQKAKGTVPSARAGIPAAAGLAAAVAAVFYWRRRGGDGDAEAEAEATE